MIGNYKDLKTLIAVYAETTIKEYGTAMGYSEDWALENLRALRQPGQEDDLLCAMKTPWGEDLNADISIRLSQAVSGHDGFLQYLYCWVVKVYYGKHKGEYCSASFTL